MNIRRFASHCLIPVLAVVSLHAQSTEERRVLDADAAWAKAFSEKKLEEVMAFYHADATQWHATLAPIIGKVALREFFQGRFAEPDYKLSWSAKKVSVSQSRDLAYTLGSWVLTQRRKGQIGTSRGTYLAVWRRSEDGRWLVVEDMFNLGGG